LRRIVSIASRTFLFSYCVYLEKYYKFIRKSFFGSEAKDLENYYSEFYVLLEVAVKVSLGVLGHLPDLFCPLLYARGEATWGILPSPIPLSLKDPCNASNPNSGFYSKRMLGVSLS
jgi:hypothetical protein